MNMKYHHNMYVYIYSIYSSTPAAETLRGVKLHADGLLSADTLLDGGRVLPTMTEVLSTLTKVLLKLSQVLTITTLTQVLPTLTQVLSTLTQELPALTQVTPILTRRCSSS